MHSFHLSPFQKFVDFLSYKALQFVQQVRGTFRPPLQVAEPLCGRPKLRILPDVRFNGGHSRHHRRPPRRRRTCCSPRQSRIAVQVRNSCCQQWDVRSNNKVLVAVKRCRLFGCSGGSGIASGNHCRWFYWK